MNKSILILILILFISSVLAIRINEIEMNPVDGASGNEWIELYNDGGETDISLWEIYDGVIGQTKIFTIPSGIILKKDDYYIAELNKAVLNNNGDFVTLYDSNGKKIDETEMLKETSWGSKTWQLCDDWEFAEATKGEENDCGVKENLDVDNEIKNSEYNETNQIGSDSGDNNGIEEWVGEKEIEVIELRPKDIKTDANSKNNIGYTILGFAGLFVLGVVVYILKFRKSKDGLK